MLRTSQLKRAQVVPYCAGDSCDGDLGTCTTMQVKPDSSLSKFQKRMHAVLVVTTGSQCHACHSLKAVTDALPCRY